MKEEKINLKEFAYGWHGHVSGKHYSNVSRHSRKEKLTSCIVTIKDLTNGAETQIEISEGHYSKKEMQKLREKVFEQGASLLFKKRKKL